VSEPLDWIERAERAGAELRAATTAAHCSPGPYPFYVAAALITIVVAVRHWSR
jgi:hypothetical protein